MIRNRQRGLHILAVAALTLMLGGCAGFGSGAAHSGKAAGGTPPGAGSGGAVPAAGQAGRAGAGADDTAAGSGAGHSSGNSTATTRTGAGGLIGSNADGSGSGGNGKPASAGGSGEADGTAAAGSPTGATDGTGAGQGRRTPRLVTYTGPVEHIFFHPLIIYPQLAFDHDSLSNGYDEWFVTIPEFKKILDQLYANRYMLIDIHDLYKSSTKDGKPVLIRRTLKLPAGKKPLILSIDDLNYYDYMRENGNGYKLVLDDQGRIAVYGKDPSGNPVTSRDNGIVPLLDQFVADHPDFSFHGAKGIVNLTGYEGVLGYRTNNTTAPDYAAVKEAAIKVIRTMKREGWDFASHGYGHLHDHAISYSRFAADTDRWLKEVEPLTGPTDLYVFPFGEYVAPGGKKYGYLVHKGFHGLIGIGPRPYLRFYTDSYVMDRRHIDGISLETQQQELKPLFDANSVLDPIRAKLLGNDLYSKRAGK